MSRLYRSGFAVVLLSAAASLYGGGGTAAAEPVGIVKVSAADLASGKVIVIGKLGVPLKTMTTIRGTWQPPPRGDHPLKDTGLLFHVTHVDGKVLDVPVDFHRAIVEVT